MSLENRIIQLATDITTCEDDGDTAVLAEQLLDLIQLRMAHLRKKQGLVPLEQNELSN
jgi:hypothetical protein